MNDAITEQSTPVLINLFDIERACTDVLNLQPVDLDLTSLHPHGNIQNNVQKVDKRQTAVSSMTINDSTNVPNHRLVQALKDKCQMPLLETDFFLRNKPEVSMHNSMQPLSSASLWEPPSMSASMHSYATLEQQSKQAYENQVPLSQSFSYPLQHVTKVKVGMIGPKRKKSLKATQDRKQQLNQSMPLQMLVPRRKNSVKSEKRDTSSFQNRSATSVHSSKHVWNPGVLNSSSVFNAHMDQPARLNGDVSSQPVGELSPVTQQQLLYNLDHAKVRSQQQGSLMVGPSHGQLLTDYMMSPSTVPSYALTAADRRHFKCILQQNEETIKITKKKKSSKKSTSSLKAEGGAFLQENINRTAKTKQIQTPSPLPPLRNSRASPLKGMRITARNNVTAKSLEIREIAPSLRNPTYRQRQLHCIRVHLNNITAKHHEARNISLKRLQAIRVKFHTIICKIGAKMLVSSSILDRIELKDGNIVTNTRSVVPGSQRDMLNRLQVLQRLHSDVLLALCFSLWHFDVFFNRTRKRLIVEFNESLQSSFYVQKQAFQSWLSLTQVATKHNQIADNHYRQNTAMAIVGDVFDVWRMVLLQQIKDKKARQIISSRRNNLLLKRSFVEWHNGFVRRERMIKQDVIAKEYLLHSTLRHVWNRWHYALQQKNQNDRNNKLFKTIRMRYYLLKWQNRADVQKKERHERARMVPYLYNLNKQKKVFLGWVSYSRQRRFILANKYEQAVQLRQKCILRVTYDVWKKIVHDRQLLIRVFTARNTVAHIGAKVPLQLALQSFSYESPARAVLPRAMPSEVTYVSSSPTCNTLLIENEIFKETPFSILKLCFNTWIQYIKQRKQERGDDTRWLTAIDYERRRLLKHSIRAWYIRTLPALMSHLVNVNESSISNDCQADEELTLRDKDSFENVLVQNTSQEDDIQEILMLATALNEKTDVVDNTELSCISLPLSIASLSTIPTTAHDTEAKTRDENQQSYNDEYNDENIYRYAHLINQRQNTTHDASTSSNKLNEGMNKSFQITIGTQEMTYADICLPTPPNNFVGKRTVLKADRRTQTKVSNISSNISNASSNNKSSMKMYSGKSKQSKRRRHFYDNINNISYRQ